MGDHALDLLSYLGLETKRVQAFEVDTSPVVVDKHALQLTPNIRLTLAQQLFQTRANLSEKRRSSSFCLSLFSRSLEDNFRLSVSVFFLALLFACTRARACCLCLSVCLSFCLSVYPSLSLACSLTPISLSLSLSLSFSLALSHSSFLSRSLSPCPSLCSVVALSFTRFFFPYSLFRFLCSH